MTTKSVEQIVQAVQALDLDPIKLKLMDPEQGQGWSREHADRMELAYKRYLTLLVKFPEETIAPTKDVDKFWHGHILDTMKYAEDCERIFGYFLHHFPYFGMRGEADAAGQRAASDRMHTLYESEYGEQIPSASAWCYAAAPASKVASAWCYAAKPSPTAGSAWCYAAKPPVRADSAWCYAARPNGKAGGAWCYAAHPAQNAIDAKICPALAPAG